MENEVIEICGTYPEGFQKIEISSNPNYIFINDPNFTPVKVWDIDQNSVLVNSFIECEHYVTGGWNYNPILNAEAIYQNRLSMVLVFSFAIYMLIKKKQLLKNE
ncbi:MAG: hypothetical protein CL470_08915 [Acidimicrobiaceae bacterium]|nr:hypothetical protein [Acidimicrobiaceae bacterium]